MDYLTTLIEKLPAFDPTWPPEACTAWLNVFERLANLATAQPAAVAPASPPPAPPARRSLNTGKRRLSDEQRAALVEVARRAGSNQEACNVSGLPMTTVRYHMAEIRKEVGVPARYAPAPFRPVAGAGADAGANRAGAAE